MKSEMSIRHPRGLLRGQLCESGVHERPLTAGDGQGHRECVDGEDTWDPGVWGQRNGEEPAREENWLRDERRAERQCLQVLRAGGSPPPTPAICGPGNWAPRWARGAAGFERKWTAFAKKGIKKRGLGS